MGTCKECKYYHEPTGMLYGECTNSHVRRDEEIPRHDELVYFTTDGTNVYHCVGQDFGCIHFKPKEEEKG
jgi:hypothetical protein